MGYPFPQGFAGSNPARSTITPTRTSLDLLKVFEQMKSNGLADATMETYQRRLRFLNKNTMIGIPQITKDFIIRLEVSNATKEGLTNAYDQYTKYFNDRLDIFMSACVCFKTLIPIEIPNYS
jgi:hypothetical protein